MGPDRFMAHRFTAHVFCVPVTTAVLTQDPLVSVVTPVYNGATYLRECIESVLAQTYTNWEYTIVDNASTDETPDIAARFADRDSRIRHLRFEELVDGNENHNRAFRAASADSEFCKVVQADDWLFPECLERMIRVAEQVDTIAIVGAYRLWEQKVDQAGLPYWKTVLSGREILRQSLLGRLWVTGAPTAVLYRSRFVRECDPFYPQTFEHADTEAAYRLLSKHDFGFVHQVLTFARRQTGARMEWASHMNTYVPENTRFLLRYGPEVLEPAEYRQQLRLELRRYISFHFRQLPKPSRLADGRFFAIHQAQINGILEEGGDDAEVRAAMLLVKTMLLRGRGRETPVAAIR
jgi:glycosyltransferase involved in cell wall biosynthesis